MYAMFMLMQMVLFRLHFLLLNHAVITSQLIYHYSKSTNKINKITVFNIGI